MSPSHTRKRGRIYRYYVSQALLQNQPEVAGSIPRVAAAAIEDLVVDRVLELGRHDGKQLPGAAGRAELMKAKVDRVVLGEDEVTIQFARIAADDPRSVPATAVVPITLKRAKGGAGAVTLDGDRPVVQSRPDRSLIRAIARAHYQLGLLRAGEVRSIASLARRESISPGQAEKIIRLAFLAPDIVEATIAGRQPASMSLADLLERDLPANWAEQRVVLGFNRGPTQLFARGASGIDTLFGTVREKCAERPISSPNPGCFPSLQCGTRAEKSRNYRRSSHRPYKGEKSVRSAG